ncbi:carboxypeptidase regulatory-like domain-containing protein [bacterium]|nr:carboxypeptidase regulatory-like domain-containing protein [candidate division CSSED10-310 bacterium]
MKNKTNLVFMMVIVGMICAVVAQAADTKGRYFVTIHDSQKNPLVGVTVTLTSVESAEKHYSIETNESGKALIVGLDPDMYKLKVDKEGYQYLEGTVKLRPGVNVKHEYTMLTIEEARDKAIQDKLDNMTEEERNNLFAKDAHNAGVKAYQNNDLDTAEAELTKAISLNPNVHYVDYLILGQIAFNNRELADAQKYLSKAKELDVNKEAIADISTLLGATYMIQENTDKAREIWSEQMQTAPDPTVLHSLASIEVRAKDLDTAIKWLTLSCEKFPDYTDCIQLLGDIYIQKENYPEALNAYKKLQEKLETRTDIAPETLKEVKDTVKLLEETVK